MKAIAWLVGGFVLLGLSGMIEAVGDTGATAAEGLPLYLAALAVLLGAPFCFFKAFRAAFAGKGQDRPAPPAPRNARPAHRIVDPPEAAEIEDFDPDAAFARYMAKRTGQTGEAHPEAPVPTTLQAPPSTFGRKIV
jgi:hypothetical protein